MGYFDRKLIVLPLPTDPRNAGIELRDDLETDAVPGYWVKIKDKLDFGDVSYRNKRVVHVTSKGVAGTDDAATEWELDQFGQATLERGIVAWNIEAQLRPEFIQQMDWRDATFIVGEIGRRNPMVQDAVGKENGNSDTPPPSKASTVVKSQKSLV